MKIGLVIYDSLDSLSGGYLYDRRLVERLRAEGHQVETISLPWRDYPSHLRDNWSRDLLEQLAGASYDLLLQDELNHPSLFLLNARLRRRARYPILAIVHHLRGSETHPRWRLACYRWIERRYLRALDGFILNSETTRRAVEAMAGARCRCLVARPGRDRLGPGLPRPVIAARSEKARALMVVFVGNVIARKGVDVVLNALARLPRNAWRLTIVGRLDVEPGYVARLRRLARAARLEDNVTFAGRLSDDDLRRCLSESDAQVMPSSYEGYGMAYAEAMGFGLPPLATTAGAANEIITHGHDGYLVDPGDVEALVGHLRRLATDRQHLRALSLAARDRHDELPTWDETTSTIVAFLEDWPGATRGGRPVADIVTRPTR